MNKISGVYQIVNTVTKECYVGSSKDVKSRWASHKCPSAWKRCPNSLLYQDFQKYGLDKFRFQILCSVEPEHLKQVEQKFIEMIQPTYNDYRANGQDVEKLKEWHKKYYQSEKGKKAQRKYQQSDKGKKAQRKYLQSEKCKEYQKKYLSRLCLYNDKTFTLNALSKRFCRAGIEHPVLEAKKYLLEK